MITHRAFPHNTDATDLSDKLASLALPSLTGKSFLDVGCGEGFFCGYAAFDAASKIVGIDKDGDALTLAREKFPYCDFREGGWENLDAALKPGETFDVILMTSSPRYAGFSPELIHKLIGRLTPDGVLVLETGIVAKPARDAETPDQVEILPREQLLYPDWNGAQTALTPYVFKYAGKSAAKSADSTPRHVFHVSRPKPVAILLTGAPASGKTSIAKTLSCAMKVINGDALISNPGADPGEEALTARLSELIGPVNPQRIDLAIARLCARGGLETFARLVAARVNGENFIYDGYLPAQYVDIFALMLEALGFRVLRLETPRPEISPHFLSRRARAEARKYQLFLNSLEAARKMRKIR